MAFRFKQFSVEDDRCSMKVGTDAVLLGSWAKAESVRKILEVGAGSGVISLMLAQRFPEAIIDAIEIDKASANQAGQNITNSPWKERIHIISGSFQEYHKNTGKQYDLIISNPPFFQDSLKPKQTNRLLSKHTVRLSYHELLFGAGRLGNRLIVILPWLSLKSFKQTALLEDFYIKHELKVIPREGKNPSRIILELTKQKPASVNQEELLILDAYGNYTEEYQELTGSFYLGSHW